MSNAPEREDEVVAADRDAGVLDRRELRHPRVHHPPRRRLRVLLDAVLAPHLPDVHVPEPRPRTDRVEEPAGDGARWVLPGGSCDLGARRGAAHEGVEGDLRGSEVAAVVDDDARPGGAVPEVRLEGVGAVGEVRELGAEEDVLQLVVEADVAVRPF